MLKSVLKKFSSYLFLIISLTCILCFIYFNLVGRGKLVYKNELPLVDVQGIVQRGDTLYVGISEFSRVQVYFNEVYHHHISTNTYQKDFNFKVYNNGSINLDVVYKKPTKEIYQVGGNKFQVNIGFFSTEILKNQQVLISQPFGMSLIAEYRPILLMLFSNIIVFLINISNSLKLLEADNSYGFKNWFIDVFFKSNDNGK